MADTKIEWTEKSWNPIRGCKPVSEGCRNCYAARFAHRFSKPGEAYEGLTKLTKSGPKWTGKIREVSEALTIPLETHKPSVFFVNSMSDMFHDDVSEGFIDSILEVIMSCPQHLFQVLTKRPENIGRKLYDAVEKTPIRALGGGDFLTNLWLGVSVEDQESADKRLPELFKVPAALYWISAEPLLGGIDIEKWLSPVCRECNGTMSIPIPGGGQPCGRCLNHQGLDPRRLGWVVCGGESGYGARPMDPSWPTNLLNQCRQAEVPFFFKQWGNWVRYPQFLESNHPVFFENNRNEIDRYLSGQEHNKRVDFTVSGNKFNFWYVESSWMMRVRNKKEGGRELLDKIWDEYPARK